MKLSYISLGCPKNEIDLEFILGGIGEGVEIVDLVEQADAVIINTCAFIDDAKQESIDKILEAVEQKKDNPQFKVFVSGCLPQRYKDELRKEIPQVDEYFDTTEIATTLRNLNKSLSLPYVEQLERLRITPSHFAYLKIAEGCNNRCSYCAIPLIKGDFVSRPYDSIMNEAQNLVSAGVREIMLVAQDTTMYGRDLDQSKGLDALLRELNALDGLEWIRLLYTHPAHWQDSFIHTIAELDKVVKYIDLPVQHISDPILKAMGRNVTRKQIETLIRQMRKEIPELMLRTTVITGYPGETEDNYLELLDFVQEFRFERLGAFTYSHEEGTRAYKLPDDIPADVKEQRKNEIMELQAEITYLKNKELIGKKIPVIIDEIDTEINAAIGRTQWDAPEIDNSVLIPLPVSANIGDIVNVKITNADIYDLHAKLSE